MVQRDTIEVDADPRTRASDVETLPHRLERAASAARTRAQVLDRPVLAWASARAEVGDALELFDRTARHGERWLWEQPDERISLAGIGSAWTCTTEGPTRFGRAESEWRRLVDESVGLDSVAGLTTFFGFAFSAEAETGLPPWDAYPNGLLAIPHLVVRRAGDVCSVTAAVLVEPSADPPGHADVCAALAALRRPPADQHAHDAPSECSRLRVLGEFPSADAWKHSVRDTAAAVANGSLRKAALARGIRIGGTALDPGAALRSLREDYPSCTVFAVARGPRCFLGATPERLARVRGMEVSLEALAGSAPRGSGPEEDRVFGERLLASVKDGVEHAVVVEHLRHTLAEIGASGTDAPAPVLRTVRNVHHLYTPLRAVLRGRHTMLDLVDRLHPSPAVGGAPRADALRWIRRREGWNRGWYAGPVGWMDGVGDGDAVVAIRSALVDPTEAHLFAGCGIVADSDPDEEYAEATIKLRAVLSALGGAPRGG